MPRSHPFQAWPAANRRRWALAAIGASLAMLALFSILDAPLQDASPEGSGTIDYEFAGTPEDAAAITGAWEEAGESARAGLLLGLDFLFPLLYAAALAAGAIAASGWLSRAGLQRAAGWGPLLAWGAFAAAAFDSVENIGLAVSLLTDPASPWPQISFVAATIKFALVGLAALYALAGLAALLRARRSAPA